MAKKLLAFLLTFALMLSTVTAAVMVPASAADVTVWDGTVAEAFAGGSGTKADPYLISNGAELAYLFNSVITTGSSVCNNKYYKLTADIYLNDVTNADWKENNPNSWYTSVYTNGYRFTGNFDGAGHTVYGMYYSGDSGYIGLLPVIDVWNYDVVVKDLTISDSFISTSGSIIGAVSPRIYSKNYRRAHFYNVKVTESVTVKSSDSSAYVGGFVGFADSAASCHYQFSGCASLATVSSGHALLGYCTTSLVTIVQSYASGNDWYPNNSTISDTTYLISDISTIYGKENAAAAMPGLDWLRIWNCKTEGYPFPMDYKTNTLVGHTWTGVTAHEYAGGSGTATDPYIIENAEQLALVARDPATSGKYYRITRDIAINDTSVDNWTDTAIQWFNSSVAIPGFAGTLDGDGHTISGLYYNSVGFAALFPKVTATTEFKNITISNSSLTNTGSSSNDNNVSAFVSNANGATTVKFNRCFVDDTVVLTSAKSAAGLVGYGTANVIIANSGVAASITASRRPGAFTSDVWSGTKEVFNSYAVGTVMAGYSSFTATNTYITTGSGATVVTAEQMQGESALDNMPDLLGFAATEKYPIIFSNTTDGESWSGFVALDYESGSGTAVDPYIIKTAEQLAKLVSDPYTSGKYYALGADIKVNDTSAENWKDTAKQWYGYSSSKEYPAVFAGTLNGGGHKITGLYNNSNRYFVGLFASMGGATVKNVIISDSSLTSSNTTGTISAFTGYVGGAINYSGCVVDDTVTISGAHASGYGSYGSGNVTVDSCVSVADISGSTYTGAFFADIWSSTLKVSNSFGLAEFSPRRAITSTNNYGTIADSYGTNVVTAEQMQGADALTNMPLLTGYFATEGYPVRYADGTVGTAWNGGIAPDFAGGSGTEANPYVIKTSEQFARMLNTASKNNYYVLGADLILSDDNTANCWLNSNEVSAFAGTLDGKNYIISGLYYSDTATGVLYTGLIPTANGATVKNIILEDSNLAMITNSENATYVGGIVGYVTGATTISNCYVAEDVVLSNKVADGITTVTTVVGGILGGGNAPFVIDGCAFFGTMDFSEYRYGSVFGDMWSGTTADRVIKNTVVDKYTPSSRWGFKGENNITVAATIGITDENGSFTVVESLKGEDGINAIADINTLGRYFGTEGYPAPSVLGARFKDVNGDRVTNALDLSMLRKNLLGTSVLGYTDINADGNNDIRDIVNLKKRVADENGQFPYVLVWSDEFDGDTLDATKWNTSQTRMSDTDELAQSNLGSVRSVSDGNLQLSAIKNEWYNAESESYFERHKYVTTGSVTTENRMSYQYGYLEIRAKAPYKEGCWPSIWLRSHNATDKQADANFQVEVDLLEVFGSKTSMASNLHQQGLNGQSYNTTAAEINEAEVYTFANAENLANEYHTYGFEWTEDKMAIYVDRVLQCEWYLDEESLASYGLQPDATGFDTTMNLLINNHLFTTSNSGVVGEENIIENYESNLPAEFDIDWVRLYQKYDGSSKLILGE